jgi:hypothetical protein
MQMPQCSTNYSSAGNSVALDIVIHQNIRLTDVIFYDFLDSDHLPVVLHILNHVNTKNLTEQVEKFTERGMVSKSLLTFNST